MSGRDKIFLQNHEVRKINAALKKKAEPVMEQFALNRTPLITLFYKQIAHERAISLSWFLSRQDV